MPGPKDFLALLSDPDMLQLMLVACADGIVATDQDGVITLYTGASETIFRFDPFEVLGRDISTLLATPEARRLLFAELEHGGRVANLELPGIRKDSEPFVAAVSAAMIRDRYGEPLGVVMYVRDHSNVRAIEDALRRNNAQLNHLVSKLDHLARHDQLTRLLNRGSAVEAAADAILATGLEHDMRFGVALFDIDHFKQVNDSHGHLAGDLVLASLGNVLRSAVRAGDIVGRFGGEEFVAFLPGANLDQTAAFAERVRAAIEAARVSVSDELTVAVTVSAGVAAIPGCADSLHEALRIADDRLYAAKRAGRNRIQFTDEAERRSAA
ncbi:MAG TPA: diguanylate cyclase, partial [Tepidiformaceae bacterium]|nr:diguanylate cyclase [Tepidiformaceae bacterium]HMO95693.1 diguanylate cyclase [Tepidiformaceae bacterium]